MVGDSKPLVYALKAIKSLNYVDMWWLMGYLGLEPKIETFRDKIEAAIKVMENDKP